MGSKMVWSIDQIEDCFIVTRQVEVDKDDEGNSIFNTSRRSRENLPLAINEVRASLDLILKQAEKDSKTAKK
jgi:hypothetical protein